MINITLMFAYFDKQLFEDVAYYAHGWPKKMEFILKRVLMKHGDLDIIGMLVNNFYYVGYM